MDDRTATEEAGMHPTGRCVPAVDVRRAVMNVLLRASAPLAVADVVRSLREPLGGAADHRRVSDVLRYQTRIGRVRRVRRGIYEAIPCAIPKATAWRCLNWQLERARWRHRRLHLLDELPIDELPS